MLQIKQKTSTACKYGGADKYFRALRLPFVTASIIPFIAGTLLQNRPIDSVRGIIGLIAVVAMHLGANLINDYSDSKSGADWHDKRFYGFFGGSKLIQEKVFSERSYLTTAQLFLFIACLAVIALTFLGLDLKIIGFFLLILFLGVAYSFGRLRFSYRYLGETVVFVLFGPAIVMGAYFIQTNIFPAWNGFFLSLPFAFLITAILIANEVPDFYDDIKSGKLNLISLIGVNKAYILYYLSMGMGLAAVLINIMLNTLGVVSLSAFLLCPLILKAGDILKREYKDKIKLVNSSKLTIAVQTGIGLIIIADLLLRR